MTYLNQSEEFMQILPTGILAAVGRGEIDLNALARAELILRGLDHQGKWVGFEQARALNLAKTN